MMPLVKTTIDIPDALYHKAQIRAAETGQTLTQLVLASLEREFAPPLHQLNTDGFFAKRRLLPDYAAALEAGAFSGGTDSTDIISEERSAREEALF